RIKVLLAQALFGNPDILLLDEPTNNLDNQSVAWLENFLMSFPGTLIVVSHDRWFLNNICTHIVDIDYNQVRMYVGNYDFWYESSRLMQRLMSDQKKRRDEKILELKAFIQRFSSNKSKAKQATSRRRLLDQLTVEEMPASSRRYPYVAFNPDREAGKDILTVDGIAYTAEDGVKLLDGVSFLVTRGQKIALVGSEQAATALFRILAEEIQPDSGSFKWGVTISTSYFPHDNTPYFEGSDKTMMEWFAQYSPEQLETYMRQFLGRMLFSGDDVYKPVKVLSGGEKVRLMLSRMMLSGANFLMLDQPTNHLDLESITAVNNALIAFPGTVIFTCHDHQFVSTVADRIIELHDDGTMTDYNMGYEDYLARKAQEK
ncbi:MAG: ABC-F family ATP-binding cassette domain-containing protein, partial [Clostridia bacterium]|nr:ABC-F family ATP-binding cassette domain-containing protein [Clostridia bacterium]